MLEYFPGHYSWSLGVMMAVQLGGELTEIDAACRPLPTARRAAEGRPRGAGRVDRGLVGARREAAGLRRPRRGAGPSRLGGRKYRRACIYWFTAERMTSHKRPEKRALYDAMTRCFAKSVALRREPIEFVTIPVRRHDAAGALPPRAGAVRGRR
jgi:hypothetical protein